MSIDSKRLLLAFEQRLRQINRETLNPLIEEMTLDQLDPLIRMVAQARGQYLQQLVALANSTDGGMPQDQQIKELQRTRIRFDELSSAAKALETAIDKGYLDVKLGSAAADAEH